MFDWTNYSDLTRLQINVDTILLSNRQFDSELDSFFDKSTLWSVWHAHMHNSTPLTNLIALSTPKSNFCSKILKLRELFAFYTSRKLTLFTQQHYFTEDRKKEEKNLSDSLKVWFN